MRKVDDLFETIWFENIVS